MKIAAFQMDPLARLNIAGDSTLALAEEALRRGMKALSFQPHSLSWQSGTLTALARPLEQAGGEFHAGKPQVIDLAEADIVLMRQDPPFNREYTDATYLLEKLLPETPVCNHPGFVRSNPEKLLPLRFPQFIPPTLISAQGDAIRAFHREHGEIVIKPLHGYAGHGVCVIRKNGENLESLLEILREKGDIPLVVQPFLPEVAHSEMRVLVVDGQVAGAFIRVPPRGEIRSNLRVGGTAKAVELNPRQRSICEEIGSLLAREGVLLAGLDLIGDQLIEVNITSPTGIRQVQALTCFNPAALFWDAVERQR